MKTQPMSHQDIACKRSTISEFFAFMFEMGCGKTWSAMNDAETLFEQNKIDAILVAAPKGVHTNWVLREIPQHMSIETICYAWQGTPKTKKALAGWQSLIDQRHARRILRVFAINIDAFNTETGRQYIREFLKTFRCAFYVDESSRIKNPSAERTKNVQKLGRHAKFRRILSGTPLTKSPIDLFSQFDFLSPGLLGKSYREFTAQYAVLVPPSSNQMRTILERMPQPVRDRIIKTGIYPQIVQTDSQNRPMYKNMDKLVSLIAPYSHRVRKVDCLDLPPKVYKTLHFELEKAQRDVYDRLLEEYEFATDLDCITFEAIAARSKMRQVASGYIRIRGELQPMPDDENPRLTAFKELIDKIIEEEEDDYQFIVFSLEQPEHEMICKVLRDRGISLVEYVGSTKASAREAAIDSFQAGEVRAFVGNPAAAGIGLTLTAASCVIYYSTDCDWEKRVQSEDRAHRKGQTKTVVYWDLVAENTLDEATVENIKRKSKLATQVVDSRVMLEAGNQL